MNDTFFVASSRTLAGTSGSAARVAPGERPAASRRFCRPSPGTPPRCQHHPPTAPGDAAMILKLVLPLPDDEKLIGTARHHGARRSACATITTTRYRTPRKPETAMARGRA